MHAPQALWPLSLSQSSADRHLQRKVVLAASAFLVEKLDALKVALAFRELEIKILEAEFVPTLAIAAAWRGRRARKRRQAQKGDDQHHR